MKEVRNPGFLRFAVDKVEITSEFYKGISSCSLSIPCILVNFKTSAESVCAGAHVASLRAD